MATEKRGDMLALRLFGSLGAHLRFAGHSDEHIPLTGRPGSLLAYLALSRGHFFTRSDLASTLWGERASSRTLGSFNTTLWRLRKAVEKPPLHAGDVIASDKRGAIGMPRDAHCVLDVEEFEKLVLPALVKPIERLDASDVEHLREGAARYQDDILAGFVDDWALREREKQRRHYFNVLGRLMQISTLAQDHAGAIGYAQRILDRDMLREDIHRELMRLLLANGQRALALRQFERCRDALRRELAIQPMRETMALYHKIAARAVAGVDDDADADAPVARSAWADAPVRAASPAFPIHVAYTSSEPPPDARSLIEAARRHLALADDHLQRTLAHITPPSPPTPDR